MNNVLLWLYIWYFWYFIPTDILCYDTFTILVSHISCFWIDDQGSHGKQEFECMLSESVLFFLINLSWDLFNSSLLLNCLFTDIQFQACLGIFRNCYWCRSCCNLGGYWPWGLLLTYNKKAFLILVLVNINLVTFGSYLVHCAVLPQLDWQQVGSYPIKAHYSFVNMHSPGLFPDI